MNKKNRMIDILISVLVSCFVGMISGAAIIITMNDNQVFNKIIKTNTNLKEIDEMYTRIVNKYYEDVDENTLIEGAIAGMLSVLDNNSSYLNENSTTSFNNKMQGEYYGVGIEGLTLENTGILVVTILENSPAQSAGIKEGDILYEINDISLKNKTATYFSNLIEKLRDNELNIKVLRNEEEKEFTLKAEKIVISSVSTNTFYKDYKKVGYIKISIFAANTSSQFITKLQELESGGIDSLIIDVRDNAGGYLSNVSTILELFMPKDTILYKLETKEVVTERKDKTEEHRDYPIVVLINGSSASASEILAASLNENFNSELIGNTTYGKGTVQETVNVLDTSMAKITTKKWLTPKGIWINEKGIVPTMIVNIDDNYLTNPIYENDNQLESAINIITKK